MGEKWTERDVPEQNGPRRGRSPVLTPALGFETARVLAGPRRVGGAGRAKDVEKGKRAAGPHRRGCTARRPHRPGT